MAAPIVAVLGAAAHEALCDAGAQVGSTSGVASGLERLFEGLDHVGDRGQRATLAQRVHGGLEGLDRLPRIGAIHEDGPRHPEEGAEDRVAAQLLLAHAGHVAAQHLENQHHIEGALVVEDENGWASCPEVFLTLHAQVDAGERGGELAPHRTRHVDPLAH